jgi:hypothetical protein
MVDITAPTASDNCGSVTISHVGDVSDMNTCPEVITRTYRATDACGNTADCVQLITVDDDIVPTITCPGDTTVNCTEGITPGQLGRATATDNCDVLVANITFNDVTLPGGCAAERTIERTWTATDACGNMSTCLQTIMVQDTTPPVVLCPSDTTINCTESTDSSNVGVPTSMSDCITVAMDYSYVDNVLFRDDY